MAANPTLPGLHHVTAITADAQANIDFYSGVLGLKLVKLTVNFDDPYSYHLYYGDALGRPGTIMTFFAWPGAPRGRAGPPQVTAVSFVVPRGSQAFWAEHLGRHGVDLRPAASRFGERVVGFSDPDGIQLELIETDEPPGHAAASRLVPAEHAIRGFHGVTLTQEAYEQTSRLLTDVMGFGADGSEGNRVRHRAGSGSFASFVDLLCAPDARRGSMGAGIVHHVAFRAPDDAQQAAWRVELVRLGMNVSPVMDRKYFHSIYFREPGGVLFEIATDDPGFTIDEPADQLGTVLKLPPQFESHRAQLERSLPPLERPG